MRPIILFTGHRDKFVNNEKLDYIHDLYPDSVWISGGAVGFDTQVYFYAKAYSIPHLNVLPNYRLYSDSAPLRRNDEMVNVCDLVVACYDGREKGGTFYTINKAKELGKEVIIFEPQL